MGALTVCVRIFHGRICQRRRSPKEERIEIAEVIVSIKRRSQLAKDDLS